MKSEKSKVQNNYPIEKINLNGVDYLKEADVRQYYTRKDEVDVDRLVLEASLQKMPAGELASFLRGIAEEAVKKAGWVSAQDMLDQSEYEAQAVKRLLLMASI